MSITFAPGAEYTLSWESLSCKSESWNCGTMNLHLVIEIILAILFGLDGIGLLIFLFMYSFSRPIEIPSIADDDRT
jgi:hypothetical protein